MSDNTNTIAVEIIYALPDEQELISFKVNEGATVMEAIEMSGILNKYPEIDLSTTKVGIFSKVTKLDEVLREQDRIEIYRPLIADPKEMRRKKALKK
ncbi:RnfH family protein [Aliikangiella sp. G2MR2-5]|uniref:RnfH family protein n=1 Tax=Aliikangiella sp. G2MR2-5 TaxID=2788943 RepID=UPI0018AACDCC|nr:RnfH family protein [Aliikangiella sp. G2MR2-5]